MKYKLLVLDLDGTLTNAKKEITLHNREALIRVQQQGVKLILASGRPTFGIVPLADELRMKEFGGFILSYNGGEIIDWSTGEIVYANVLPDEVIPRLYECATRNQLPILTTTGNISSLNIPMTCMSGKRLSSIKCRYILPQIF